MMALFFDELMLHRVYGFTPDWNERLIKTVQLAGARVEGRIRKRLVQRWQMAHHVRDWFAGP